MYSYFSFTSVNCRRFIIFVEYLFVFFYCFYIFPSLILEKIPFVTNVIYYLHELCTLLIIFREKEDL